MLIRHYSSLLVRVSPRTLVLLAVALCMSGPRSTCLSQFCDDGVEMIARDLNDPPSCPHGEKFHTSMKYEPAGYTKCSPQQAEVKCMDEDITYSDSPPSSGPFRPIAPKYGEYSYLPPQRWLRALERGAIAFLYHPCAAEDQVSALRDLASSCLWKHVITPYPNLTSTYPLALVSWGCVNRMSWVNAEEAMDWIRGHALKTPESAEDTDGVYEYGLIKAAGVVSTVNDDVICPKDKSPGNDDEGGGAVEEPHEGEGGNKDQHQHQDDDASGNENNGHKDDENGNKNPCVQDSSSPDTSQTVLDEGEGRKGEGGEEGEEGCSFSSPVDPTVLYVSHGHLTWLVALLVVAVLLVLGVLAAIGCHLCSNGKMKRKRKARYKCVSKFFPFYHGREEKRGVGENVAIPEFGVPSAMPAEREKLLNSDEEEVV